MTSKRKISLLHKEFLQVNEEKKEFLKGKYTKDININNNT